MLQAEQVYFASCLQQTSHIRTLELECSNRAFSIQAMKERKSARKARALNESSQLEKRFLISCSCAFSALSVNGCDCLECIGYLGHTFSSFCSFSKINFQNHRSATFLLLLFFFLATCFTISLFAVCFSLFLFSAGYVLVGLLSSSFLYFLCVKPVFLFIVILCWAIVGASCIILGKPLYQTLSSLYATVVQFLYQIPSPPTELSKLPLSYSLLLLLPFPSHCLIFLSSHFG